MHSLLLLYEPYGWIPQLNIEWVNDRMSSLKVRYP